MSQLDEQDELVDKVPECCEYIVNNVLKRYNDKRHVDFVVSDNEEYRVVNQALFCLSNLVASPRIVNTLAPTN